MWNPLIVSFAMKILRKLSILFHGTARLLNLVGILFLQKDIGAPPSLMRWLSFTRFSKNNVMDIIIMGCWNIWMQRNEKIKKNEVSHLISWKYRLKKDLLLINNRTKAENIDCMDECIESLR